MLLEYITFHICCGLLSHCLITRCIMLQAETQYCLLFCQILSVKVTMTFLCYSTYQCYVSVLQYCVKNDLIY